MSDAAVPPAEAAARLLVASRRGRKSVPGLPQVHSFDEAYAVQVAFRELWGVSVIGHKVGCSSEQSQRLVNSPGPIAGSLFRDALWHQPATIPAARFFIVGVEAEFGFRLGADLPARSAPYSREEVSVSVDAVVPVIEICDTRLSEWRTRRIEEITADNAFNGGLVVGTAFEGWHSLDLATHVVTLSIDGEQKGEGTGALVLGHPLLALTWLANDMSRRGSGLRAGDLVAAGTCTGLHFASPGSTVVADFGTALGKVTIHFAE
jgi:2-keto-4-pentenoate hydratase